MIITPYPQLDKGFGCLLRDVDPYNRPLLKIIAAGEFFRAGFTKDYRLVQAIIDGQVLFTKLNGQAAFERCLLLNRTDTTKLVAEASRYF